MIKEIFKSKKVKIILFIYAVFSLTLVFYILNGMIPQHSL